MNVNIGGLCNVLAAADEQIAALARQFDQQRLIGARGIVNALAQRSSLRADISRAAGLDPGAYPNGQRR